MSNDLNSQLERLLQDSTLIKMIQKLAGENEAIIERRKITKQDSIPTYVNRLHERCNLCSCESITFALMNWDPTDKLYRNSKIAFENTWTSLPLKSVSLIVPCCSGCASTLLSFSKEDLVSKLCDLSTKLYHKPC